MDRIVVFLYLKFSSTLLAAPGQPAGNNFDYTLTLLRLFCGVNNYFQLSFGGVAMMTDCWAFATVNHGDAVYVPFSMAAAPELLLHLFQRRTLNHNKLER